MKKLSIIIPAYNESKTIIELLEKVQQLDLPNNIVKELIIVNDCSTDNTEVLISEFIKGTNNPDCHFYSQSINKGKGAAIQLGIEKASGDYIIMQDADLELDPTDIILLVNGILAGKSTVIYGSRFIGDTHQNTNFIWHILGNNFLTKLCNLVTGYRLTDMMTCYKLVPASALKTIKLKENRFGFEPEITVKLSKMKGITVSELPIQYTARTKSEGKKINWKDGMKVIYCILRYKIAN